MAEFKPFSGFQPRVKSPKTVPLDDDETEGGTGTLGAQPFQATPGPPAPPQPPFQQPFGAPGERAPKQEMALFERAWEPRHANVSTSGGLMSALQGPGGRFDWGNFQWEQSGKEGGGGKSPGGNLPNKAAPDPVYFTEMYRPWYEPWYIPKDPFKRIGG